MPTDEPTEKPTRSPTVSFAPTIVKGEKGKAAGKNSKPIPKKAPVGGPKGKKADDGSTATSTISNPSLNSQAAENAVANLSTTAIVLISLASFLAAAFALHVIYYRKAYRDMIYGVRKALAETVDTQQLPSNVASN